MSIANKIENLKKELSTPIVAVSKTWPAEKVREAYAAGQKVFAENYIQEALAKMDSLKDLEIQWHFIGNLQRKNIKKIADRFALIHSVDRKAALEELNKRTQKMQNILIQVNFAGEGSKLGFAPEEVPTILSQFHLYPKLKVQGIMAMPPFEMGESQKRELFQKIKEQQIAWQKQFPDLELSELSMGTTGDYQLAIECGSTMVRLGTLIFGERTEQ